MDDRESIVPKFSLSEEQKARLVWMSEQERIPVDQAFEVLMDYYQHLGERDLEHLNSVIFLGKELKLREISAKAVLRYLTLMQELATRNQTLDHLDAALEMMPSLERTGLTPGSVPEAETIYLAARLTASEVTVNEVERWLTGRQHRRRLGAPPGSLFDFPLPSGHVPTAVWVLGGEIAQNDCSVELHRRFSFWVNCMVTQNGNKGISAGHEFR